MADIESPLIFETAALNINPAPEGMPPNSSPNILYSDGRESLAMLKRWWNRVGPTVTSGGSANAQTLTYTITPTEGYKQGQHFSFIAGFNNSGATTLNVNGLGAKNIFLGGTALTGGEIISGSVVVVAYDSTQFHIVAASAGRASPIGYLPLSGGTLTGALASNSQILLDTPSVTNTRFIAGRTGGLNRWAMYVANAAAESGSNAGSDFVLQRYTDAGTFIDSPLAIVRASGIATFAQNLVVSGSTLTMNGANGVIQISGAAATNRMFQYMTGNNPRWQMYTESTAEGGSNAGSNWVLQANADNGTFLGSCISAVRSTQIVTFAKAIVNGPSDRSLKENIAPLEGALDKVMALKGVSFNFIATPEKREIGLIAQDVEPIVPEVIQPYASGESEGKNLLAVDYPKLVALLVEGMRELTTRVATLEAKLAAT